MPEQGILAVTGFCVEIGHGDSEVIVTGNANLGISTEKKDPKNIKNMVFPIAPGLLNVYFTIIFADFLKPIRNPREFLLKFE